LYVIRRYNPIRITPVSNDNTKSKTELFRTSNNKKGVSVDFNLDGNKKVI